jgi:diguanylate cyclase (GGDEF)-like protein/PAS domain S-box-containing protein
LSRSPGSSQYLEEVDDFELEGNKRYFESRLFPIHTPDHNKSLFGYLAIDVTERILAEQDLKESEEKYSSYIENAPYGIFVVNNKGQYIEVNSFASALTGYSRDRLVKMSIGDITAEESLTSAMHRFETLKSTGNVNAELKYIHEDGSIRWWTVDAVKLSEDRYLVFSIDITEKKDAEENLHYLSNHDFLTGLHNRRSFEAELQRLDMPSQLPLTIMFGDINGVKLVNDAFGHADGDRLIVDSAKILSSCCRKGDILARIGGDEFEILMPKTDNATALDILNRIYAALNEFDAKVPQDKFLHSVSLGFATKTTIDEDVSQISRIAEQYMYERKLLEHNSSHSAIISSIKAIMNEKSHETAERAERLVVLSKAIVIRLNMSQTDRDRLELLATLHDIGKVGISERILTKQGKLSEDEWVEMRRYPEIGYRIAISAPDLIPIAESILCHHEWWDGRGYPQGLSGENIPLLSRILSIVVAYDAMTQGRPYRHAMTHEEAIAEIMKGAGTQFDPQIAQIMIENMR